MSPVKMLDLFSGSGGWGAAWKRWGHEVFEVDIDPWFKPDLVKDVKRLTCGDLPWYPDIVVASPPCHRFSVGSLQHYWNGAPSELMQEAFDNVTATVELIQTLQPRWYIIENPRGMLRTLDLIPFPRYGTTLCRYGAGRMKPTDFWGRLPGPLRPGCHNGQWCHPPAPRGSRQGTQGLMDFQGRAEIPYAFSLELLRAALRPRP